MKRLVTRLAFAMTLPLSVAACGGGQTQGAAFDPQWQSDDGLAIGVLQQKLAAVPIPLGADVAVAVIGKDTLLGLPLDGGAPWTAKHALDTRPSLAGGVVVGLGAGELFALDARTGKQLWKREGAGVLRGAGDDGKTTVVSLTSTNGSLVLAIAHDGTVIRQIEDAAAIGVPAVVDGYAFLPWQTQYVTAYDLSGGEERARVLLRSPTSRAFTQGGALFFGEIAVTRFDDKIRLGARSQASTVSLPARELPAGPHLMLSGNEPLEVQAEAVDKVRMYARPLPSGPPGMDSDRFVATYYRIALGFGANEGRLAWAHHHDSQFIGGAAYAGGVALCDTKGKVTFFDVRTGGSAGEASFGKNIDSCVVQIDGLKKEPKPPPAPLADQIASCVMSPEQELATIQRFLLRELTTMKDDVVTKALVQMVSSDRTSPLLLADARSALASRRTGAAYLLGALEHHYDYMAESLHPPPVAPIADALLAMKERRAAPLLASHLLDPNASAEDVQHAAAALAELGGKSEVPALQTFFAMYRGATGLEGQEMIELAVVSSAQALKRLGEGAVVTAALADPFTSGGVKARLAK